VQGNSHNQVQCALRGLGYLATWVGGPAAAGQSTVSAWLLALRLADMAVTSMTYFGSFPVSNCEGSSHRSMSSSSQWQQQQPQLGELSSSR
jgi:hypothetical protein